MSLEDLIAHSRDLRAKQDLLLSSLPKRGVRALFRRSDVRQIDGSVRRVEYSFQLLAIEICLSRCGSFVERLKLASAEDGFVI
jgi:hypothetical protein